MFESIEKSFLDQVGSGILLSLCIAFLGTVLFAVFVNQIAFGLVVQAVVKT